MAVPAATFEKFPQSIAHDSCAIRLRISDRRLALADARDLARLQGDIHAARLFTAALREVARCRAERSLSRSCSAGS
jgi:hypothetical protein